MKDSTPTPERIMMADLKTGDKFIIPDIGGMNIFVKQSGYHGFIEYHYKNSQGIKRVSVSNCTVYKFQNTSK